LAGVGSQARRTIQDQGPVAAVPAVNRVSGVEEDDGDVVIAEVVPETVMVIDDSEDESEGADSDVEVTGVQTREEVLQAKITVSVLYSPHGYGACTGTLPLRFL